MIRHTPKKTAFSGCVSFVGAVTCAFIASELWSDLTTGTQYFRQVPRPLKPACMAFFAFWCVLESRKVHSRILDLMDYEPNTVL
ncbi:hypothetical protein LCGC14_0860310 [marine sediment metagenome]|uniref:Uncharacterized protein n=1 Tax=marine sediment metagenome TaxID=412755 RepID=A0A0F9SEN1_9ZZZZ